MITKTDTGFQTGSCANETSMTKSRAVLGPNHARTEDYGLFLPAWPRVDLAADIMDANGAAAGAFLALFLSDFGFFFSRVLRICPLAILVLPEIFPTHKRSRLGLAR